ncbi:RNA exonuclease 4 [Phycodurus eques]|uniref:RNA exonuclease 4 n=1 Tax=Phycodurus eques TaxID=693459 RepID=UPI002ACECEBF|nr:RNA exonuclease 4 [Phycodurus eques]
MKVVVMSKVKPKKKKQLSSETGKDNSVKKKKKYRIRMKLKKKAKEEKKAPSQLTRPPKDAKLFSSNWKALQEILKSNQMTAIEPKTPQQQPSGPQQEKKNKASKNVLQNNISSSKTDSEQKVKHKSVDSQAKIPVVTDANQSAASKRKNAFKANGQAAKKQKVEAKESKPTEEDIWFDDVDPDDIEATVGAEAAEIMRKRQGFHKKDTNYTLVKENAFQGLTRAVAIDCEMVGVGPDGEDSILARVSLVNQFGKCVYDKFVKPSEKVTDYRTAVSGIRPQDIKDGENIATVRTEVAEILKGRIVVGHALQNDFKILLLDHPKKKIRDTQKYKPFRKTVKTNRPSLKLLCKEILNVNVQQGEHSSVQDAQATMRLYTLVKKQWEADIKNSADEKREKRKPKSPKNASKRRVAGLSF